MRPQSAKAKGRRLQQELVAKILATFPHLEPDDVRNTPMGTQGEDIMLSPQARKVFPFAPECKNVEALNIWEALKQAEKNARIPIHPLVVFRRNNTKTYAVLELDILLGLLKPQGLIF